MRALTAIGEVGIECGGRSYILRPSLFCISRIGSPKEIVETFVLVQSTGVEAQHPVFDEWNRRRFEREQFSAAWLVLAACIDGDPVPLIGGWVPSKHRSGSKYSPGAIPPPDVVTLARILLQHGVIGVAPALASKGGGSYLQEFDASDIAASAMAHLGLSEQDAWNLTMTGFVRAMRAKYPPDPKLQQKLKPHTAAEYDVTMAKLEKINAMRAGAKNV